MLAVRALLLSMASFTASDEPSVPKEIAVPPGHYLLLKVEGKGVQIYKAVEGKSEPDKLEWKLDAPLASLFNSKGEQVGNHYDGPSWEAADGSKVMRDGDEAVAQKSVPAPNPREDIPWLLVKVKAAEGKVGTFTPVVSIQRLQTSGGKAPAELPKRPGTKVGVTYRAAYYLYVKANE